MHAKLTHRQGLWITVLLSITVLTIFYGNLFGKLNQVSFASGGDGMQSFVNMDYHIRYDTTYLRCNSMNYPYGEHVFFTNNQPLISNTIRFISRNITDVSDYALGVLNGAMLLSLLFTPVFLYLILAGFGTAPLFSAMAAVGINFLTPQLDRFGGHFNLSYVIAIPLMIWLLIRFFKKPGWTVTLTIFAVVIAGALTHFYLYGFFGVLILFFFASYLVQNDTTLTRAGLLLHLFVQLVLPFLILQTFYLSDHVTDRPGYPWGFLYYRAYPQSVFLPLNFPYGQFLRHYVHTEQIDWEGYAYAGFLAVAGLVTVAALFFGKLLKGRFTALLRVTPERSLNILFWAALSTLIYSFGIPFIFGMEQLADLIGPIRQMRGISRFSWLFFYIMNLIVMVSVWKYRAKSRHALSLAVVVLSLLILYTEAYYNVRHKGRWLENHIPGLVDRNLTEHGNQWIHRIPLSDYQAIIPLPYFHIGSENIWIDGGCDIVTQNFIALDRSGIPSVGVMLSRTSISQTIHNVAMMLEPSRSSTDMSRFPSDKPFLLMAMKCSQFNTPEKYLLAHAQPIDSTESFVLYKAPVGIFREIYDSLCLVVKREFESDTLTPHGLALSNDTAENFVRVPFDTRQTAGAYSGPGSFTGRASDENVLFSGSLPHADTSKTYTASFWLGNIDQDLVPRILATLVQTDLQGREVRRETFQVFRNFKMMDGTWALVEWNFRLSDPRNTLTLSLSNPMMRKRTLQADNVLIRPSEVHVFEKSGNGLVKDNRIYTAQ